MPSKFNNENLFYHDNGKFQMRVHCVSESKTITGWADRGVLESDDAWLLQQTIMELGVIKDITYSDALGEYDVSWDDRLMVFPDSGSLAGVGDTNFCMPPLRLFDEEGKPYTLTNRLPTTATSSGLSVALMNTVISVTDVAGALPGTALSARNAISIHNLDATDTVYIGNSDVTADQAIGTTAGWELSPNTIVNYAITDGIILFGRCTGGNTALVKIQELS